MAKEGKGPHSTSKLTSVHVCMQAPLLAHTMLHHPRAWPKQEAALGLLISLRKYFQTQWVRISLPCIPSE